MKLYSLFSDAQAFLEGFSDKRFCVEEIFCSVLSLSRSSLYLEKDRLLSDDECQKIKEMLSRRKNHEPLGYIIGNVSFLGYEIFVDRRVLIPRPETEYMVHRIIEELKKEELKGKVLVDLCTGSGAIAIALKKHFRDLEVIAIDISLDAITVARENARRACVDIDFCVGDLFEPLRGKKIDYLVSNPPYVTAKEYETVEPEIAFEPKEAFVAKEDGLFFYKKIATQGKNLFSNKGKIFLEMGALQGKKVEKIFQDAGMSKGVIKKDLSSKDRFFFLEIE